MQDRSSNRVWGGVRVGAARGVGAVVCAGVCVAGAMMAGCDPAATRRVQQTGNIFAYLQPPTPVEVALMATNPFDADQRLRGIVMLANASFGGEEPYVKMYVAALGGPPINTPDVDVGVRAAAALALGLRGGPQHVPLIVPLLKEGDARVRLSALRALQRLHNPVAIDSLLLAARAETELEPGLRAEAATALGQYADRRVLQTLVGALRDDSLLVNRAALESLRTLTGQDLGDDQLAWLKLATDAPEPFAGRKEYRYPIYTRDRYWFEWLPLWPTNPPVELPGTPAGMQPVA